MISTTLNNSISQINLNNKDFHSFLTNNSSTISSLVAIIATAYFLSLYFHKKPSNPVVISSINVNPAVAPPPSTEFDVPKEDSNANASKSVEVKSLAIKASNPVSSLQERQQFELINKMQTKGLIFENIPETNIFICDNSFIQIKKVLEDFPESEKKDIGRFFYSPENNAICCNFDEKDYGIIYPTGYGWTSFIRISKEYTQPEHSPLALSNGKFCSEKEFIENPLFASTLEKRSVFRHLSKIQETRTFKKDYQTFLRVTQSNDEHWANSYRKKPIDLAYLSLFAYLDGKIVKEELFIVQMLASAFLESPDSTKYVVLTKANVKDYLLSYNYLTDENKTSHFHCLENLDKKSLIERTAFSKQSKKSLTEQNAILTVDWAVYYALKESLLPSQSIRLCNKKSSEKISSDEDTILEKDIRSRSERKKERKNLEAQKNNSISTLFLPPWLCKRLNAEIAQFDNPLIDHEEYFGYRRKLDDLLLGRPVSYASPLFYIPEVHDYPGTQLGITSHDIHFHCFLDFYNPHAKKIIQLAEKIRTLGKDVIPLVANLLDRPIRPNQPIANFISALLSINISFGHQEEIWRFYKEIFVDEAKSIEFS